MKTRHDTSSASRKLLFGEEVYRVIGAAMEVSTQLGNGFLEAVYQEALALELPSRRIPFEEQSIITIKYKGQRLLAQYSADFVCFDCIIVEIKAIKHITPRERAQLLNYLKATEIQVGLLINFGSSPLEWKRFIMT